MSTSVSLSNSAISWKQEVSRRIAAHQSQSLSAPKQAAPTQKRPAAGSRCAQAVARVAERYAQAPSYSQMLIAEAQTVQQAIHAASPGLETTSAEPRPWEPELPQAAAPVQSPVLCWTPTIVAARPAVPSSLEAWEGACSSLDLEPDFMSRPADPPPSREPLPPDGFQSHAPDSFASQTEDNWEQPDAPNEPSSGDDLSPVEPDLPIHANLIEFPRELVAARKRRPQRAEGPFAAQRHLSIFEVDPVALPIQPAAAEVTPAWSSPEWSSIELEAQPGDDPEPQAASASELAPQLAPTVRRFTAALVDGALIAGAITGAAMLAAANISHPLPAKVAEISVVCALLLAGLLYQTLFLALAQATPGMKCAGISLCTFDGYSPTCAQSRLRLGALVLSVLPLGLGVAWALFDDDHLCWHDRLSKTYLRRS